MLCAEFAGRAFAYRQADRAPRTAATGRHAAAPGGPTIRIPLRRRHGMERRPRGDVMLTPRQHAAYEFIAGFIELRGFAPSYDEIRRHLRLRSLNAVAKLVAQLRRRGAMAAAPLNAKRSLTPLALRRVPGRTASPRKPRSEPRPETIPLLGLIAAGQPIEAIEDPEPVPAPASLLGRGERYALRVRGDSMVEDGIQDGDLIVVRRALHAENGQTVVAIVDGGATLKRFYRSGARVELRPANRALRSTYWHAARVEIRGVLVGLLRRYS